MITNKNLNNLLPLERLARKVSLAKNNTRLRAMDPKDNYNAFNLMIDLSSLVRDMIKETYNFYALQMFNSVEVPDFAILLYGSPARREMTTYSDIDIHIMDHNQTSESIKLKECLTETLGTFGFGKVDDPNWKSFNVADLYAARSITEGNQIIDAIFVCGDTSMANKLDALKNKYDTVDRNIRNIFFQWFYLDHYYSRRSTTEVPNVKYCKGGYRELLTFDWFDKTMGLLRNDWIKNNTDDPLLKQAINNLKQNNLITPNEFTSVDQAVNFITLLRNEVLQVNIGTSEQGYTHLDVPTMLGVWDSSPEYFKSFGLQHPTQISHLFQNSRKKVRWAKELMWKQIINHETKKKGLIWRKALKEILNPNGLPEKKLDLANTDDQLLQIASIWGAHYSADKALFSKLAYLYLFKNNWEVLASLACSSLCPSEVLDEISTKYARQTGLGYIFRIIGRNPNTSKQTLQEIAFDASLDKRYRIVAQLNLEKGLIYATTRA